MLLASEFKTAEMRIHGHYSAVDGFTREILALIMIRLNLMNKNTKKRHEYTPMRQHSKCNDTTK